MNKSIKKLNLSNNHFGSLGAENLKNALLKNNTIKYLDLSRNALGFQTISSLLCACTARGMDVQTNGNYVFEEILNSLSHGLGFLASIVGANLLISQALEQHYTDYHFWACVLYSFSLLFLFLSSTLFHSFFMMPQTSRILQVLDHVGIYMLIAGTYTPFLLIGLHHHSKARVLLVGEWIFALLGSIFATCSDLNSPTTTIVELVLFLIMGFSVLLVWDVVSVQLDAISLGLLVYGGVAYVVGIIFFVLGEYKPIFHTVWHLFVVLGAGLHWFDIYFYIASTKLEAYNYMGGSDSKGYSCNSGSYSSYNNCGGYNNNPNVNGFSNTSNQTSMMY